MHLIVYGARLYQPQPRLPLLRPHSGPLRLRSHRSRTFTPVVFRRKKSGVHGGGCRVLRCRMAADIIKHPKFSAYRRHQHSWCRSEGTHCNLMDSLRGSSVKNWNDTGTRGPRRQSGRRYDLGPKSRGGSAQKCRPRIFTQLIPSSTPGPSVARARSTEAYWGRGLAEA